MSLNDMAHTDRVSFQEQRLENEIKKDADIPRRAQLKVIAIGVVAALAGLISGLDIGVVAGALSFIGKQYNASTFQLEWVVSAMMAGAAFGALCAGWMSRNWGRKKTLLVGAAIFIVGTVGCTFGWSVASLIAFRAVMGIAVGVCVFTAPLYLSEIAHPSSRGAMVSTYQLMVTVGIFIAFLSGTFFTYSGNWRAMFGVAALPAILCFLGIIFLPYSPRWLLTQGRQEEARKILLDLRAGPEQVDDEIQDIKKQLETKQKGWSLFKHNSNFRRSVAFGMILQAMQQLTGINIIMYYAPKILETAHFDTHAQMWCTAMIGLVNMLATFIAIALVDRWGRRPILFTGFIVMAIGMGLMSVLLHTGLNSHLAQLFAVFLLMFFCTGFAMSAGPLMWVLCAEIQPLAGRSFGIALSTFTNWFTNMLIGLSFLTLMKIMGADGAFMLFALFNGLFIVITYFFVPETKGTSLEKIEKNLMSGVKLRDIGRRDIV